MAVDAMQGTRIVLGQANRERVGGFRWLSPALIGLIVPLLIVLIAFPMMLGQARSVVVGILLFLLIISIASYIVAVLVPGQPSGLLIDQARRRVAIVRAGPFAESRTEFDVSDIADLRIVSRYDDDGYGERVLELVDRRGERHAIPIVVTPVELEVARQALGLVIGRY